MKTSFLHVIKQLIASSAMRFSLVIGILVLVVSIGKSQSTETQQKVVRPKNSISPDKVVKPQSTVNPQTTLQTQSANSKVDKEFQGGNNGKETQAVVNSNSSITPVSNTISSKIDKKTDIHAPDPNDPDFEAKKAAWIKNYPDEYNALQQTTPIDNAALKHEEVPLEIKASSAILQKKWAHAPDPNDPDYTAKKDEWKYNYPEEYNAYLKETPNPNLKQNVGLNPGLNQPSSTNAQKVAGHAPDINDPAYNVKKAAWIKNYPEEYEQLGGLNTKPMQEKNK
jgi:hypothetical protein